MHNKRAKFVRTVGWKTSPPEINGLCRSSNFRFLLYINKTREKISPEKTEKSKSQDYLETPYNFKVRSILVEAMYWAFFPNRTPVADAVWSLKTCSSCHCLHRYTLKRKVLIWKFNFPSRSKSPRNKLTDWYGVGYRTVVWAYDSFVVWSQFFHVFHSTEMF